MELIPLFRTEKGIRYARTTDSEENKAVADAVHTRIVGEFPNAAGLRGYFKHNPGTGVNQGSTTFHGILVNQEWMRRSGGKLWVPSVTEYKVLEKLGRLTNDVYRDMGNVVYSADSPNKEIAQSLIEQSGKETPIVVASFKGFGSPIVAKNSYGLNLQFSNDTSERFSGKEGQEFLEANFPNRAKSGVHRLNRNWSLWNAYWGWNDSYLGNSNDGGRVGDFVCGEATAEDLEQMAWDIDNVQIEILRKTQQNRMDNFRRSLDALR